MPKTEILQLPGGRRLAYIQWGALDGHPVIHLHGTPGSRLERYFDDDMTTSLGVRFITFDRPGYGATSRAIKCGLVACAEDIAGLADHLGLDRFGLHGFSGGGPYVLAAAWALRNRVSASAILAGLGPLDRPDSLLDMTPANVAEFTLARDNPHGLPGFLAKRGDVPKMPQSELDALARMPELLDVLIESHIEVKRQGWSGVVIDDCALVAPWEFDVHEILTPVYLWHGDGDNLVPMRHAEHVAAIVPNSRLQRCPREGHLDMFKHQHEILSVLVTQR
jgi:pimeloyl-ACP methyl ester carboxylesterase